MAGAASKSVALVTGGSSGIGWAVATRLAEEGMRTIIADVRSPGKPLPRDVLFIACDVSKGEQVDYMHQQLKQQGKLPGLLVCNAGLGMHEQLAEGDPEKWQSVLEVNVMGALRCVRSFVPEMLRNKKGDVVFVSSVSAWQAYPFGGVYAASKAALEMIAETLRMECQDRVRVMVISPGTTRTSFFASTLSGNRSMESQVFEPLDAVRIADSLWFALSQPREVSLSKIIIRPTGQVF